LRGQETDLHPFLLMGVGLPMVTFARLSCLDGCHRLRPDCATLRPARSVGFDGHAVAP